MYKGQIAGKRVAIEHPFVAMEESSLLGQNSTLAELEEFLAGLDNDSARIYQHNGAKWELHKYVGILRSDAGEHTRLVTEQKYLVIRRPNSILKRSWSRQRATSFMISVLHKTRQDDTDVYVLDCDPWADGLFWSILRDQAF